MCLAEELKCQLHSLEDRRSPAAHWWDPQPCTKLDSKGPCTNEWINVCVCIYLCLYIDWWAMIHTTYCWGACHFRATSYTRLRARHHCTSSTLIGGNGGAGPSVPPRDQGSEGLLAFFPLFYIMDYEVLPCSSRVCDWLLSSSWDHLGWHQERRRKMQEWPWNLRSLKGLFSSLHYPLSWSNGFCDESGNEGSLATNVGGLPWRRGTFSFSSQPSFLLCLFGQMFTMGARKEGKKKGRRSSMKRDPKTALFGHIYKKFITFIFWVHSHFSWSMVNFKQTVHEYIDESWSMVWSRHTTGVHVTL